GSAFQSGTGLPVPKYIRFRLGSYEPVTQLDPPPCSHTSLSAGHVSCPDSPGPGTVLKRHTSRPVFASKAAINPRMPYSPPAGPMITLSLTTSGAIVKEYPSSGFDSATSQIGFPFFASIAIR